MDDWAKDCERELRHRIADFFVFLEFAAETSIDADVIYNKYREQFCIDDESACELRRVAYRSDR